MSVHRRSEPRIRSVERPPSYPVEDRGGAGAAYSFRLAVYDALASQRWMEPTHGPCNGTFPVGLDPCHRASSSILPPPAHKPARHPSAGPRLGAIRHATTLSSQGFLACPVRPAPIGATESPLPQPCRWPHACLDIRRLHQRHVGCCFKRHSRSCRTVQEIATQAPLSAQQTREQDGRHRTSPAYLAVCIQLARLSLDRPVGCLAARCLAAR